MTGATLSSYMKMRSEVRNNVITRSLHNVSTGRLECPMYDNQTHFRLLGD